MSAAPPSSVPGYTPAVIRKRRTTFFAAVLVTLVAGVWLLYVSLARDGLRWSEAGMIAVFVPLFYQLSVGFWTAMTGLALFCRRSPDPLDLSHALTDADRAGPISASTAVIMPVYNENVSRVFEGLRVMYQSLEETGQLEHFDFFVLSDSDNPGKWIEEERAWLELCRQLRGFGRIFYRKRRKPINRKPGNVSDFCRRWGRRYRYMVVLDADSIMSGSLMTDMVRIMEKHPAIGILQTAPRVVGAETLFGRVMQFAHALYGETFVRGMNYLMMGEATFWGHNAILRLAPFMEHCGLPELPGREPFGGHILSHDFVEAALMCKAGYQVWLMPADGGSYEEGPPTLIDTLKRDRRWCQGNMQHFWLLFARGWPALARLNFLHGILSYVASPLWLAFLLFATVVAVTAPHSMPVAGEGRNAGLVLLFITLGLLFVPKILIALREVVRRDVRRRFHSARAVAMSVLADTVFFFLLAPVLMMFHSKFVLYTVLGRGVKWAPQRRRPDGGVDWEESILTGAGVTAFALAWSALALWRSPEFFAWISPVLLGIAMTIPFSIFTSGVRCGRSRGLFTVREEIDPPRELSQLQANLNLARLRLPPDQSASGHNGLLQVLLDPYINALHVSLLRQRSRVTPENREYLDRLRRRLVVEGPDALHKREINAILYDPDTVLRLHYELWAASGRNLAEWWERAMRAYNIETREPVSALSR